MGSERGQRPVVPDIRAESGTWPGPARRATLLRFNLNLNIHMQGQSKASKVVGYLECNFIQHQPRQIKQDKSVQTIDAAVR